MSPFCTFPFSVTRKAFNAQPSFQRDFCPYCPFRQCRVSLHQAAHSAATQIRPRMSTILVLCRVHSGKQIPPWVFQIPKLVTQQMEKLRGPTQDGEVTERLARAGSSWYPTAETTAWGGGFIRAQKLGPDRKIQNQGGGFPIVPARNNGGRSVWGGTGDFTD